MGPRKKKTVEAKDNFIDFNLAKAGFSDYYMWCVMVVTRIKCILKSAKIPDKKFEGNFKGLLK